MTQTTDAENRSGIINAISAYFLWGFAPIYFKLINTISPGEILIHRILWSSLLLLVIIMITRKWHKFTSILKQPKLILKLTVSASLLAVNWFLFIWAINNNHLLDASLGYFINPLFNVALGMLFLGERLRKWQKFAVILAIIGVLIQLVILGSLPIISLALACSFGLYGLLRKKMHLDSFIGLLVESLMMLPIALAFWLFFVSSDTSDMFNNGWGLNITLMMAGVVTTAPLLCFTAAAKRLTLASLGFFQYIGPSIMFVLATFFYQETIQPSKMLTFAFIWLALIIYSIDSLKARKAR
ncbi:MAG: chloramphenicol-sensitive protein RarD [Alteromonadaceae bacterium]|jgi:chloramphenicol-sensitive protein RarD|tara:strand:- start:394 stop:1287 length:894 start_codon:yes stop_codon:yes gene_type:complete